MKAHVDEFLFHSVYRDSNKMSATNQVNSNNIPSRGKNIKFNNENSESENSSANESDSESEISSDEASNSDNDSNYSSDENETDESDDEEQEMTSEFEAGLTNLELGIIEKRNIPLRSAKSNTCVYVHPDGEPVRENAEKPTLSGDFFKKIEKQINQLFYPTVENVGYTSKDKGVLCKVEKRESSVEKKDAVVPVESFLSEVPYIFKSSKSDELKKFIKLNNRYELKKVNHSSCTTVYEPRCCRFLK